MSVSQLYISVVQLSIVKNARTVAWGRGKLREGRCAIVESAVCVEECLSGGDIGDMSLARIFCRCVDYLANKQGVLVLGACATGEKRSLGGAVAICLDSVQ